MEQQVVLAMSVWAARSCCKLSLGVPQGECPLTTCRLGKCPLGEGLPDGRVPACLGSARWESAHLLGECPLGKCSLGDGLPAGRVPLGKCSLGEGLPAGRVPGRCVPSGGAARWESARWESARFGAGQLTGVQCRGQSFRKNKGATFKPDILIHKMMAKP